MSAPESPRSPADSLVTSPGSSQGDVRATDGRAHRGVELRGENGVEGPKAFYIHIEARPGKERAVMQMLRDIYGCVLDEPATGPWFAVRYCETTFGIFEAFPSIAGRDAHVAGGGGDIFRDSARMNDILAYPAQVHRVDVLLIKALFAT